MSEKTFLHVLSGNPAPAQVAALTILFAGLASSANAEESSSERNQWGNLDERLQRHTPFNPSAFTNVNYF